jgi:hypothetical protein
VLADVALAQRFTYVVGRAKVLRVRLFAPRLTPGGDKVLDDAGEVVLDPYDAANDPLLFALRDPAAGVRVELTSAAGDLRLGQLTSLVFVVLRPEHTALFQGLTRREQVWEVWVDDPDPAKRDPLAGGRAQGRELGL